MDLCIWTVFPRYSDLFSQQETTVFKQNIDTGVI